MEIEKIARIIEQNGGRLYLVGGAVRDSLLNRPIYDEDYCVVGIEKNKFIELFPEAKSRGKSFEVFDNQYLLNVPSIWVFEESNWDLVLDIRPSNFDFILLTSLGL